MNFKIPKDYLKKAITFYLSYLSIMKCLNVYSFKNYNSSMSLYYPHHSQIPTDDVCVRVWTSRRAAPTPCCNVI